MESSSSQAEVEQVRPQWSAEEDECLRKLVEQHGARNWLFLSASIPGRSRKSCRLRWCNHLSPDLNHGMFTAEEDKIIVEAHARYGNKWSAISRLLKGRTDNAIKNYFNRSLKRKLTAVDGGEKSEEPPEKKIILSSESPTSSDMSDLLPLIAQQSAPVNLSLELKLSLPGEPSKKARTDQENSETENALHELDLISTIGNDEAEVTNLEVRKR